MGDEVGGQTEDCRSIMNTVRQLFTYLLLDGPTDSDWYCQCQFPIDNDQGQCMACGSWISYRSRGEVPSLIDEH